MDQLLGARVPSERAGGHHEAPRCNILARDIWGPYIVVRQSYEVIENKGFEQNVHQNEAGAAKCPGASEIGEIFGLILRMIRIRGFCKSLATRQRPNQVLHP